MVAALVAERRLTAATVEIPSYSLSDRLVPGAGAPDSADVVTLTPGKNRPFYHTLFPSAGGTARDLFATRLPAVAVASGGGSAAAGASPPPTPPHSGRSSPPPPRGARGPSSAVYYLTRLNAPSAAAARGVLAVSTLPACPVGSCLVGVPVRASIEGNGSSRTAQNAVHVARRVARSRRAAGFFPTIHHGGDGYVGGVLRDSARRRHRRGRVRGHLGALAGHPPQQRRRRDARVGVEGARRAAGRVGTEPRGGGRVAVKDPARASGGGAPRVDAAEHLPQLDCGGGQGGAAPGGGCGASAGRREGAEGIAEGPNVRARGARGFVDPTAGAVRTRETLDALRLPAPHAPVLAGTPPT